MLEMLTIIRVYIGIGNDVYVDFFLRYMNIINKVIEQSINSRATTF